MMQVTVNSKALECPVCLEIYSKHSSIFLCLLGHSVCSRCNKYISKCPLCKEEMTRVRNYTMEHLVSSVKNILPEEPLQSKLAMSKYSSTKDCCKCFLESPVAFGMHLRVSHNMKVLNLQAKSFKISNIVLTKTRGTERYCGYVMYKNDLFKISFDVDHKKNLVFIAVEVFNSNRKNLRLQIDTIPTIRFKRFWSYVNTYDETNPLLPYYIKAEKKYLFPTSNPINIYCQFFEAKRF